MDLDHSEDDLDITEYFDESFHCNEDISNITNNIESVSLKEGDSFDDFDEAEFYVHRFSESKGFKIRLGRVKMIDTAENSKEVHKRTILCKHSGLFRPKNAENFCVFVTTLNDNHNYDLSSKAIQFEKDKQFTEEMWEEINFLVTKCHLSATMIRRILKEKFSSHPIFARDFYVEIQRCRPSYSTIKCDASQFYEQLLSKQWEDSRCPEQIMLWCEFNEAVGHDNTVGFFAAKLFLECHLYNRRFSWACAFTTMIFTLSIQITSFVESQNACIKRVLENSNTSLYDLNKVLIECSKEEQKRKQFEEWKRGVSSMTNATTIFPSIKSLVKYYLRPNIAHFLVEQMKESLYYTASHAIVEEIESLTSYESSQSEDIDDKPDAIVLCAMYLLKCLERTSIVEIWKISRVTSQGVNHFIFLLSDGSYSCTCLLQQSKGLVCHHFYHLLNITIKAQFSLQLIAPRWIPKSQRLDAVKKCVYFGQRFSNIKDKTTDMDITMSNKNHETEEITDDDFIDEMLFYRKVWGLARTAINKCMLHRDNEFILLIKNYLNRVRTREEELVRSQEVVVLTSQNVVENTEVSMIQLENPQKVVGRGRPKAESHHNKDITNITTQEANKKK
ncbi:28159_t:CDS:2, partial [Racocetra persica]